MTTVPPLGVCTGVVEPGVAFGGFGPAGPFAWRGSCVGMCGGRPMCAAELPSPECSGCARQRHGVVDGTHGAPGPVIARILPGEFDVQPVNLPAVEPVNGPVVLRRSTELSPHDPSLPRTVRRLAELRPGLRVFVAVAADAAGAVVASVSVRAPGVGYVVYERPEGGSWKFARGATLAARPRHRLPARPHLMRANVGRFAAALADEDYEPNPVADVAEVQRAAAPKGQCPGCGAEVSLTKAGAVYASHKCQTRAIEGRS